MFTFNTIFDGTTYDGKIFDATFSIFVGDIDENYTFTDEEIDELEERHGRKFTPEQRKDLKELDELATELTDMLYEFEWRGKLERMEKLMTKLANI